MEVCAPPDLHRLTDNAAINGVGRNKKNTPNSPVLCCAPALQEILGTSRYQ